MYMTMMIKVRNMIGLLNYVNSVHNWDLNILAPLITGNDENRYLFSYKDGLGIMH